MKARPILFSGPMVRALLDGRKTQTRRVVKPRPLDGMDGIFKRFPQQEGCPYGQPGDLLWVRETWARNYTGIETFPPHYRTDLPQDADAAMSANHAFGLMRWKPSIHMPRSASRLTLEITDVRVERLQDISEADAMAEGLVLCDSGYWWYDASGQNSLQRTAVSAYQELWRKLNGDASWNSNPWVWVLEFKIHHFNVDEFLKRRAA